MQRRSLCKGLSEAKALATLNLPKASEELRVVLINDVLFSGAFNGNSDSTNAWNGARNSGMTGIDTNNANNDDNNGVRPALFKTTGYELIWS